MKETIITQNLTLAQINDYIAIYDAVVTELKKEEEEIINYDMSKDLEWTDTDKGIRICLLIGKYCERLYLLYTLKGRQYYNQKVSV